MNSVLPFDNSRYCKLEIISPVDLPTKCGLEGRY
jgi:hypothetical protein